MAARMLALSMLITLAASACPAQAPPVGYIAIYVDDTRTSFCVEAPSPFTRFDMYVFCLPGIDGQMCADFAIDYPDDPGVIPSSLTANSHVSEMTGDIAEGIAVCFVSCQTDWHWPLKQAVFLNTSERSWIDIAPSQPAGFCSFATCAEGNPQQQCVIFNRLYINYRDGEDPQCGTLSSEPASWGAIKSLF